ncbi:hypothetical protein JOB18_042084 [Solea senegalensis]|uniref:Uncharacterized protein n=1 Tax=Solea senegalensis TaxID=28829 RepID=A0AAV6SVC7_SOLSE|nr:hypothetical protein JOB18_042084 [Solea senegalensis]
MQAFVPRLYLTPVRDEEAESQRKAKSRHARQTRRSTQGVTLSDLKEAQKTKSFPPQDRQTEEAGTADDRSCLRKGCTDERRVTAAPTDSTETAGMSPKWSKLDELLKDGGEMKIRIVWTTQHRRASANGRTRDDAALMVKVQTLT